jgi:uncharacterized protein YuzE
MKLHYYTDTDSLYIDLNARPAADSREITEGLVVDFDSDGRVVGIDIPARLRNHGSEDPRDRIAARAGRTKLA